MDIPKGQSFDEYMENLPKTLATLQEIVANKKKAAAARKAKLNANR